MLLAKGWIIKIPLVDKPLSDLKIETLKKKRLFYSLYKKNARTLAQLSFKCRGSHFQLHTKGRRVS